MIIQPVFDCAFGEAVEFDLVMLVADLAVTGVCLHLEMWCF